MIEKVKRQDYKFVVTLLIVVFFLPYYISGQSNEDCLGCHEDAELTAIRQGKTISLFVNNSILMNSVHKDVLCASCHPDAFVDEYPHPEILAPVNCGSINCHAVAQNEFDKGIHGQALQLKALYAPNCKECHGDHNILASINPKSLTYKMNIPVLCGKCHREGAPVARTYNIGEHNILENYSESIHGKDYLKRGWLYRLHVMTATEIIWYCLIQALTQQFR